MLKFFRKHNKKLLAVFMALLLVVWLGGSALESLVRPDSSEDLLFKTSYEDILQKDFRQVAWLSDIWGRLGLRWEYPAGQTGGEPLSIYDWVLLLREADRLGFAPSRADGERFLRENRGYSQEVINTIAERLDTAPEQVYDAAADFLSVNAAAGVVTSAAQVSEAESRVAARDANEKVSVNLVVLDANSFLDPEATPSEEELQALFEKHREQEAGRGMEFGYYLSPRVKAQFIEVDIEKVEAGLRVSERHQLNEAKRFWKENRTRDQRFKRPPPPLPETPTTQPVSNLEALRRSAAPPEREEQADQQAPTTQPAADTETTGDESPPTSPVSDPDSGEAPLLQPEPAAQPAEGDKPAEEPEPEPKEDAEKAQPADEAPFKSSITPAEGQPPVSPVPQPQQQYFETFAEAKEAALSIVRREEALKRATRLANYLTQRLSEPWFEMPVGEDLYRARPPGVEGPGYYENLIADVPPEFRYEGSLTVGETDWFTAKNASQVPSLGVAVLRSPDGSVGQFATLAFQVQGVSEVPRSADVDRSFYLAVYESCPMALRDHNDNLFIYRLVEVQPARPPETLDEVRDRVIVDARLKRAYDEAVRRANALAEKAETLGLEVALKQDTELQEAAGISDQVAKPPALARKPVGPRGGPTRPYVPRLGMVDEDFVEACFALGDPAEGKTPCTVIELTDRSKVAVVEYVKIEPMTKEVYVEARPLAKGFLWSDRYRKCLQEWFDPQLVRSRNGLVKKSDEG